MRPNTTADIPRTIQMCREKGNIIAIHKGSFSEAGFQKMRSVTVDCIRGKFIYSPNSDYSHNAIIIRAGNKCNIPVIFGKNVST